jgi:hypothetical protein
MLVALYCHIVYILSNYIFSKVNLPPSFWLFLLGNNLSTRIQGRHNSIIGPGQSSALGPLPLTGINI